MGCVPGGQMPFVLGLCLILLAAGCGGPSSEPAVVEAGDAAQGAVAEPLAPAAVEPSETTAAGDQPVVHLIEPGPDAQQQAQEAMILAEPGDVIEFAAGSFAFDATLSLDGVADVVIRGQGMHETILSFAGQRAATGGEGLKIKADNFVIEDLTIEDSPGDAIKLQDSNGVVMRRIRTRWTNGPDENNGAYGLYPVLSTNVLIEDCVAECASDAGIYVGQSRGVVVRNCRAEQNVAGIEIENCINADVYGNLATGNAGGILVFSLPGLTLKNGSDCRVYDNEIIGNNHPNFAKEGAMVATVPPGSGLMVMANDRVEVFGNTFRDNNSAHCLIASFLVTQREFQDADYDPFPEAIDIHDNTFEGGGTDPQGEFFGIYTDAAGLPLPDIVVDGIVDGEKLVEGFLPEGLQLAIRDNGDATFVNLDLGRLMAGTTPQVSTDLSPYSSALPPVSPVEMPGIK